MTSALALAGDAANGTQAALEFLFTTARSQVMEELHDNIASGDAALEAEISMRMLQIAGQVKEAYKATQALLVTHIVRENLWPAHPNGYAEGRKGLREFLRDCGLGESTISEMTSFAFEVVPFCDSKDILIDDVAQPGKWFKTRETLTALKQAARESDVGQVEAILSDIRTVDGREPHLALRSKYRVRRTDVVGHGTTLTAPDGTVVLVVAYVEDGEHVQAAVRKLGGPVVWDLVLGFQDTPEHIKVVIEKGKGDS